MCVIHLDTAEKTAKKVRDIFVSILVLSGPGYVRSVLRKNFHRHESFNELFLSAFFCPHFLVTDSCLPNPCLNDGECINEDGKAACKCKGSFSGQFCEGK